MRRSAVLCVEFLVRYSSQRATRVCAAGSGAQFGKGRVEQSTPAFALSGLSSLPQLPDHTFYMVTPGGAKGSAYLDALRDIKSLSTWFCVALSISETGRKHVHWLALIPTEKTRWLDHHPHIFRDRFKKRPLPQVTYDRNGTVEPCNLVFSLKNRPDIALNYLTGPRNRAKFRCPRGFSLRVTDMNTNNINNLETAPVLFSDGLGWSRGGVTPCKLLGLHSGGAERLQTMTGREGSAEPHEGQQLLWLLAFFHKSKPGDLPDADGFCSTMLEDIFAMFASFCGKSR